LILVFSHKKALTQCLCAQEIAMSRWGVMVAMMRRSPAVVAPADGLTARRAAALGLRRF